MKIKTVELLNPEWEVKERKNKLLVGRKKIGRGWHNSKQFLLPKEIELNERTAECVGLYLGDGKLTSRDLRHLDFTNKDLDLIKKMLKFFKYLGIKKSDITFTIDYSKGNPVIIKNKISEYTGKQKFRIVKTDRNRYPSLHIQVNGTIFRIIFERILMKSINEIKKYSHLRRAFLRGYFAAEGWIGHSRTENYIVSVGFAYNPKKEVWLRDFCLECLKLEGINSKINIRHEQNNGQIIITNWENYYKLWKMSLFNGCERKKRKFLERFLDTKICCEIEDKMRIKLFSRNQYELAKYLGTYQPTISNMKTGSKRNMWPTIEQINKLSEINKIPLLEIKKSIKRIRFGTLTIVDANKEMTNDIFNLRSHLS